MPLTTDTQTFAVSRENAFPVIYVVLYLDEDFVSFLEKSNSVAWFYSISLFLCNEL